MRRGPDGLEFAVQGTILKVAPVSTKYLSLVTSSVKKISPAFAGKCIAVAVACARMATETEWVRWQFNFQTKYRVRYTIVSLVCIVIVKFAHNIARVVKGI